MCHMFISQICTCDVAISIGPFPFPMMDVCLTTSHLDIYLVDV